MKYARLFLLSLLVSLVIPMQLLLAATTSAQNMGSCYDLVHVQGVGKPPIKRQLYILVDQTVIFNDEIKESVNRKVQEFLAPGDQVILLSFSAYARGRYPDILLNGLLDTPLTQRQRDNMWKNSLIAIDQCLLQQGTVLRSLIAGDLKAIFSNADERLPYTELMGTLRLLSEQMASGPQAPKRYLLIVSDMLEFSDVTSFYSNGNLRLIDPDVEFGKSRKSRAIADFEGAEVYVIGAGYSQRQEYQPAQNIEALEAFWKRYFEASNATLVAFGVPALIGGISSKAISRAGR